MGVVLLRSLPSKTFAVILKDRYQL